MESKVSGYKAFGLIIDEPKGGLVAWSDELETGIEILDQQHHRYIDLLNEYLEVAAEYADTKRQTKQLFAAFNFMRRYAEEHFSAEESIMKDLGYPEYASHREAHQFFTRHVNELAQDMALNGFSPLIARELKYYGIEWFVEHILDTDMQLARFLRQKKLVAKANEYAA